MIPPSWVETLPTSAKNAVLGQAVWKWFALVLVIGFWVLVLVVAHRYSRSRGDDHRDWQRFALVVAAIALTGFVRFFLKTQVILLGTVFEIVDTSLIAATYILVAAALLNLGRGAARIIIASRQIDPRKIDAHLINIVCRTVAWVFVVVVLAVGANRLGIPIEAVVAGLGVGGFAFAMAARPTLENLIAGVTLYLDKPVRIGDYCQFGDIFGSVEEIGLRSTRIRKYGGNLISIPNSQFADFQLDNYSDMTHILFRGKFGLLLDTGVDPLRFVLAKLWEMMSAHPKVNWPRVRMVGISEHALEIELIAYVDTVNWGEYHAVREDIYMRTLEIVEQAGTRLAVPIQMTYFGGERGPNEERSDAAEQQVKAWREAGELPFPDMSAEQRDALHRTLDYPPVGSVSYKPNE